MHNEYDVRFGTGYRPGQNDNLRRHIQGAFPSNKLQTAEHLSNDDPGLTAARLLVLSLCIIRLLYGSGNDSVDCKAKFLYELLQRR
jgi:hypothetical protein